MALMGADVISLQTDSNPSQHDPRIGICLDEPGELLES